MAFDISQSRTDLPIVEEVEISVIDAFMDRYSANQSGSTIKVPGTRGAIAFYVRANSTKGKAVVASDHKALWMEFRGGQK